MTSIVCLPAVLYSAGTRSGAVGGKAGSPGAVVARTGGADVSGELISTTYVPGGRPFTWGTVNRPFSIVAPEAISLPPPVDVRRIDPSNGAPSKVTAPVTSSRLVFGLQPINVAQTKIIHESRPTLVFCIFRDRA